MSVDRHPSELEQTGTFNNYNRQAASRHIANLPYIGTVEAYH